MERQLLIFLVCISISIIGFMFGILLYQLYRKHTIDTIFSTILSLANIFMLLVLAFAIKGGGVQINFSKLEITSFDYSSSVSCLSDSMGLTINCNDILYETKITNNTILNPGNIYTYTTDKNVSVAHRMIICLDNNCNMTIFKGDNNAVGEMIPREWLTGEVMMVEYK